MQIEVGESWRISPEAKTGFRQDTRALRVNPAAMVKSCGCLLSGSNHDDTTNVTHFFVVPPRFKKGLDELSRDRAGDIPIGLIGGDENVVFEFGAERFQVRADTM